MGLTSKFKPGNIPWNTGRAWSEGERKRLSEAHLGQSAWNKGIAMPSVSASLQGHTTSDETKNRIRQKLRRGQTLTCPICTTEFWAKPSEIKAGRKYCSTACMGVANRSRTVSTEQKKLISLSRTGDKNPMWKDGRTPDIRRIRNSRKMKQWRHSVFERDDYTCPCGKRGGHLEADHYPQSFKSVIDEIIVLYGVEQLYEHAMNYTPLWNTANGITRCYMCHRTQPTSNNVEREYEE